MFIKINPKDHSTKLTTTLNRLKDARACRPRYKKLVDSLGGPSFEHNEPINLLRILDSNGIDDALWALSTTAENSDRVARLMAADFAEACLPNYESRYPHDDRPRQAIEAARRYALGEIDAEALAAAARAARAAAARAAAESALAAASAMAAARAAKATWPAEMAWLWAEHVARSVAAESAGLSFNVCPIQRAAAESAATDIFKQYLLP